MFIQGAEANGVPGTMASCSEPFLRDDQPLEMCFRLPLGSANVYGSKGSTSQDKGYDSRTSPDEQALVFRIPSRMGHPQIGFLNHAHTFNEMR